MKFPRINEGYFLVGLTFANLFVRFFRLNDPSFAFFDEGKFYLPAAREILSKGIDLNFEHPPLAKLLFSFSISIFGDNPVGWRFFPVIFSVASVVVVYFLAKKLFGSKKLAALAAVLLSLDFGWFTTSRLAIPEVIFASLVLLSSYFLICLIKDKESKYKVTNLVLGSVFFGLALATKWSAVFVLPIFLAVIIYRFKDQLSRLIIASSVFLAVSALVYLSSFGFYLQKNSPADLLNLHQRMIDYHRVTVNEIVQNNSKLQRQAKDYKASHWPLNNIFSYKFDQKQSEIKAIVFFYNPLILWGALVTVGAVLIDGLKKKKITSEKLFLTSAFLVFWFVFLISPRIVYPYYWLAGIPFGTILLATFLTEKNKKSNQVILGFVVTALLLFGIYYPLLSNMPVRVIYFQILTGTIGFD